MRLGDELQEQEIRPDRGAVIEWPLYELRNSAFFGGTMRREELRRWTWNEQEGNDSVDKLIGSGEVLESGGMVTLAGMQQLFEKQPAMQRNAEELMGFGLSFLRELRLRCPEIMLCGISGSVSYGCSNRTDDVDIVLVARDGALWRAIAKALLLARRIRGQRKGSPVLCLSYCMDETAFRREAEGHRSRLFARDFLRLRTEGDSALYIDTLSSNRWMRDYYPKAYDEKLRTCNAPDEKSALAVSRGDYMHFVVIGTYLRAAAGFRNARFRRLGESAREFSAIVRRDRCIYESRKWKMLEESLPV